MTNRRAILAFVVVAAGIGGYWAYESYQERQRMEAWESLLNDGGCDACAARKAGVVKSQEERKARKTAEAQTQDAQSESGQ